MRKTAALLILLLCPALTSAAEFEVKVMDYMYDPAELTVKAGDTVKWVNTVDNQHTVTSGRDAKSDGLFTSKRLNRKESFSHTFDKPGEYPYFCEPHSVFKMKGVVVVTE